MKSILFLLVIVFFALGKTVFSGVIDAQERWTLEKSPYILTNDVHITASGRLVIEPGVVVLVEAPQKIPVDILQEDGVDSFGVSIKVDGAIYCEGKEHNPIVFKGRYLEERYTHWCGIILNSNRSDEILISYTKISDATTGVSIRKGMPLIRNSVFEYNNIGIATSGVSTPRIIQSNFSGNFLTAIRVKESNPEFYNNIISANRNVGVWGDRVSAFIFRNNLVYGNGDRDFVDCPIKLGKIVAVNRNGDSVDVYENLSQDPLYEGTPMVIKRRLEIAKKNAEKTLEERDVIVEDVVQDSADIFRHYRLSEFSPCIDAGVRSGDRFKEVDDTDADLGLFGGPEHIVFR